MTTLTWDEAFHQLWTHAAQHRGMNVDATPGQMPDGPTQGWPRTRGSDVLAIAAVVDPVVRTLPMELGSFGIERRWRDGASDLADFALDQPAREYIENRTFWATLAATLAYLASIDAPVPHDLWRALLAEIANPGTSRDLVSDDYIHLAAYSYDELWRVQKATLSELRGVDSREPYADTSVPRWTVPRTTNADVLQLATFWSLALIKVEHQQHAIAPEVVATLGLSGVKRRWHAVLADVDAYAKTGDPRDVYPKNHEFWRATASVSVTISPLDDLPLSLDLTVSGRVPERRNARTYEVKETTFDKTWAAQHDQMAKLRGFDLRQPPLGAVDHPMQAPRATNADILQLATYWNTAWTKLEDAWKRGDIVDRVDNPGGLQDDRARWQAAMTDVDKLAKAGKPGDVYPKNTEFWRASLALATTLGVFGQQPAPSQLLLDSPEDSSKSLPERLLDAAKDLPAQIADAAGAIAHAVGGLGREAGAGFFDGLAGPLIVGAGGLVALWLLLRHNDREDQ